MGTTVKTQRKLK